MSWGFHILIYAGVIYLGICLIYYVIQEKLIFVPNHISDFKKYRFVHPFEGRFFDTSDEGKIHSLHFKVENSKGLLLYLHGNTGSIKRWGYMAEELLDFGYDVLLLDYRGYGLSTGKKSERIMHRDMQEIYEEICQEYDGKKKVIYGRSLGTGFAVHLASLVNVDTLILETPFYSLLDVAYRHFPFLPMHLLLRYKFYSNIYLAAVQAKIHIFHGTKDRIVPYKSAYKLFVKYQNELDIEMTTLVGGRHNNLNTFPQFREKLTLALE